MEIGDEVLVQIKGQRLTLPCAGVLSDGKVVVIHEGKEYERKPVSKEKGVPKLTRELVAHADAHGSKLCPGEDNPYCQRCGLYACGSTHPFLPYSGPDDPDITIIAESVSKREDSANETGCGGKNSVIINAFKRVCEHLKVDFDQLKVRYVPLTRCADVDKTKPNYKTKGNWCRNFIVQELYDHPPKVIVAAGTTVLGLLSHKSSAPDWGGRILTYRGWPDDWITKKYAESGHPVLGPYRQEDIPIVPILSPNAVYVQQSRIAIEDWYNTIAVAVDVATGKIDKPVYDRKYFELSEDPSRIREVLTWLRDHPRVATFDTEDTGLKQFKEGESMVYLMFRWDDDDNQPHAFGFPWDFAGSPLKPYLNELSEYVLRAVYACRIRGHNLTFDMLWLYSTLPGADLNKLAASIDYDTLHMLYALKQSRGSRGLELVAYDWCPEMAGYEEEMTLLIAKYPQYLDPPSGGHYANYKLIENVEPRAPTAFKYYVMGDVEVAHLGAERIEKQLDELEAYRIPLASLRHRGQFRWYTTPRRNWVYQNIMLPSSRTLFKMMARGMFVDIDEVAKQEDLYPKQLKQKLAEVIQIDPRIGEWCESMSATVEGWELDLEKSEHLKEILFRILGCEVQRLTDTGLKLFKSIEECANPEDRIRYAATDKYTLTRLISENPVLKPLQEYKKKYKAYSGYVRPMRNAFLEGFDKHERKREQHLMKDCCVHGTFSLTGTRGGRLSSRDPNLQQLPKDGLIKRLYVSRFGKRGCLLNGDLSQIELRLIAAACGDPTMVQAYNDGTDLHTLTTSRIFHADYEVYTKEYMAKLDATGHSAESHKLDMQRKMGKKTNFLTGYGGGPAGLQSSLAEEGIYISLQEATDILEGFFESYPTLRKYLNTYKSFIADHGCAVSLTGRVREFPEIFSDDRRLVNKALRAGCNHLIQSTASDMMLTALTAIEYLMTDAGLESMLVCTVHDSLLIDTVREELPKVYEICNGVLNDLPGAMDAMFGGTYDGSWMSILPFSGDFDIGNNYLDMVKVPDKPDWNELLRRCDEPVIAD